MESFNFSSVLLPEISFDEKKRYLLSPSQPPTDPPSWLNLAPQSLSISQFFPEFRSGYARSAKIELLVIVGTIFVTVLGVDCCLLI